MALMILSRLPTEGELDAEGVSLESFVEVFQANHVQGFIARVKDLGDRVDIGGYRIAKADWFSVAKN